MNNKQEGQITHFFRGGGGDRMAGFLNLHSINIEIIQLLEIEKF